VAPIANDPALTAARRLFNLYSAAVTPVALAVVVAFWT
jgi:hypothetical protein